ncbi:hypothetical protein BH24CHL4_BH24CHL4_02690 [soil metagenome]
MLVSLTLLLAVTVGAVTSMQPLGALAFAALGLTITFVTSPKTLRAVFLLSLGLSIVGYVYLGRGFAYLGVAPLYVGEPLLGLGVLTAVVTKRVRDLHGVGVLVIGFMVFGALRTVPYIEAYGVNALRDGALWYYASFSVIVCMLVSAKHILISLRVYAISLPILMLWLGLTSATWHKISHLLPHMPGSDVTILFVKPSDRGVILAGAAVFVLVGLYQKFATRWRISNWIIWLTWLFAFLWVATSTRGGTLAVILAVGLAMSLTSASRGWINPLLILAVIIIPIALINPQIDRGSDRSVSLSQFVNNMTSIVTSDDSSSSLTGTRDYRLRWWKEIVGYTVGGEYFFTGKGFGINLADDDGFQILQDSSLRAPHNSHMTVLARMGVPGFMYWIVLQSVFAIALLKSILRSRREIDITAVQVKTWVLALWLAAMVVTSFDPYLEGPQGAILFWCVFGLGMITLGLEKGAFDSPVTWLPLPVRN